MITDFASSYDGTNTYTVRTIPKIDEISINSLYMNGGLIITIYGEGFGLNPTDNTVTVDDVACSVCMATDTMIKCSLNEKSTTTTASYFVGGMGARGKEYSGISSSASITQNSTYTDIYFTDIESRRSTSDSSFVREVEYWFVPPQNGDYIFHASCDNR